MSAQLQVFAEWLLQVAMVIGGVVFVAMCLFGVVDLLSSCVAGALKRGDAWSKITYYFAHKRRIDGWAQELRDWEMLRDELKSAMERKPGDSGERAMAGEGVATVVDSVSDEGGLPNRGDSARCTHRAASPKRPGRRLKSRAKRCLRCTRVSSQTPAANRSSLSR